MTETSVVDDDISITIESELKSDAQDQKKTRKFNGWQIFGISIGAILGLFCLCGICGSI